MGLTRGSDVLHLTCISGSIDDVMADLESIKNGTKLFTVYACGKVSLVCVRWYCGVFSAVCCAQL